MVKCASVLRRSFASKSRKFNPEFCPFLFLAPPPPPECRTLHSAGSKGPFAGPHGPAQDPAEHPSCVGAGCGLRTAAGAGTNPHPLRSALSVCISSLSFLHAPKNRGCDIPSSLHSPRPYIPPIPKLPPFLH
eukprot:scaffold7165_cov115-Isochrysis_galbana.AAC.5